MQGWAANTRRKNKNIIQEKKNTSYKKKKHTKTLKYTDNLFRKNLQLKDVCIF